MGLQLTRSGFIRQQPLSEPARRGGRPKFVQLPVRLVHGPGKTSPSRSRPHRPSPTTEHGHAPSHAHLAIPVPTSGPCCPRRIGDARQGRRGRSSGNCRAPDRGRAGDQHRQSWPGPRGTLPRPAPRTAGVPALERAAAWRGMIIAAVRAQEPRRESSASLLGKSRRGVERPPRRNTREPAASVKSLLLPREHPLYGIDTPLKAFVQARPRMVDCCKRLHALVMR
jgi:hypothetical protein